MVKFFPPRNLQRFHMETPLNDVSGFDLSHFNAFRRHVPMPVLLRTTRQPPDPFSAGPVSPPAGTGC